MIIHQLQIRFDLLKTDVRGERYFMSKFLYTSKAEARKHMPEFLCRVTKRIAEDLEHSDWMIVRTDPSYKKLNLKGLSKAGRGLWKKS